MWGGEGAGGGGGTLGSCVFLSSFHERERNQGVRNEIGITKGNWERERNLEQERKLEA